MKRIISLFLLLVGFGTALCQVPFFQHYTLLKKNEPVQINTIFQDTEGFIWLGTTKGLFRFDGKNTTRYTVADSLPDDHVTAIAQDSLGRIWTGHNNGKIAYRHKNVFTMFEPREGTSSNKISDILFDQRGNLWFATLDDGLYYFTKDRLYRLDEAEGMPDLYVYDIVEHADGSIWAGTDGGAVQCTLENTKALLRVVDYKKGLPDNIIKKLIPAKDGAIWMATEDAGIIRFDPSTGKQTALTKDTWNYGPIADFTIKGDQVWIACQQKGLLVYNLKSSRLKVYDGKNVRGSTFIKVLMNDLQGNIWAGTKTGLLRTPGDDLEYIPLGDPTFDNNAIAVTADRHGNFWFSNSGGLYKRKVLPSGEMEIEKILRNTAFEKYTVISLYTDIDGYIWAGLYGEGALRINPDNGSIKHLRKELRNGNVLSITGKDHIVWLATLGGGTMINTSGQDLVIKNYGTDDGLISDFIYQIYIDSRDRVWFATDGKGIDMMDKTGFHHYTQGLPSPVAYSVAEDGLHQIWANVQGNGLYKFNEADKRWVSSSPIVLRDNNIQAFSSDKGGNIVAMHDLGLDVIDIHKTKVRYFGEEVGLRDKLANLNAVSHDPDGNLLFGTSGGIIRFSGNGHTLDRQPVPKVTSVKLFDETIDPGSLSDLDYDENNITMNFLGLWYQNPDNIFYSYKLENYDNDWITTRSNSITYSKLPPGEYTFMVKASEIENFSDAAQTSFNISINPPFWKTITFYILIAFFVGFTAYVFIHYRERRLQYDKLVLEAQVQRRTREIQRKNEEIQAQNEEITTQAEEIQGINENLEMMVRERTSELERKNKALEEYAFINAHKLRSPVASILGLINLISKAELDNDSREITKRLQNSADELDNVVRTITKAIEKADRKYPFP